MENISLTTLSWSGRMKVCGCEAEEGGSENEFGRGNPTHYSAGPSDLKHCQVCSVLKGDKTEEK